MDLSSPAALLYKSGGMKWKLLFTSVVGMHNFCNDEKCLSALSVGHRPTAKSLLFYVSLLNRMYRVSSRLAVVASAATNKEMNGDRKEIASSRCNFPFGDIVMNDVGMVKQLWSGSAQFYLTIKVISVNVLPSAAYYTRVS